MLLKLIYWNSYFNLCVLCTTINKSEDTVCDMVDFYYHNNLLIIGIHIYIK